MFLIGYAMRGKTKEIISLLDEGHNINYMTERTKLTPLLVACYEGHLKTVTLLLERNADIYVQDRCGHNCLHTTCLRLGSSEVFHAKKNDFYMIIEMLLLKEVELRKGLTGATRTPLLETCSYPLYSKVGLRPMDLSGEERENIQRIIDSVNVHTSVQGDQSEVYPLRRRYQHHEVSTMSLVARDHNKSTSPFSTLISLFSSLFGSSKNPEQQSLVNQLFGSANQR